MPAHSEIWSEGILLEEVGGILEEVGESAGAHVGFRRERVPYNRRIIYVFGGSRLF